MRAKHQAAKDYLSQAFRIDQRINNKMAQLQNCRDLAARSTATLNGMPKSPSPTNNDAFIDKAIDLEAEVAADLQELISLKAEIFSTIKQVTTTERRDLLELRYLTLKRWEVIAIDMYCSLSYAFRVHAEALEEVDGILRARS